MFCQSVSRYRSVAEGGINPWHKSHCHRCATCSTKRNDACVKRQIHSGALVLQSATSVRCVYPGLCARVLCIEMCPRKARKTSTYLGKCIYLCGGVLCLSAQITRMKTHALSNMIKMCCSISHTHKHTSFMYSFVCVPGTCITDPCRAHCGSVDFVCITATIVTIVVEHFTSNNGCIESTHTHEHTLSHTKKHHTSPRWQYTKLLRILPNVLVFILQTYASAIAHTKRTPQTHRNENNAANAAARSMWKIHESVFYLSSAFKPSSSRPLLHTVKR